MLHTKYLLLLKRGTGGTPPGGGGDPPPSLGGGGGGGGGGASSSTRRARLNADGEGEDGEASGRVRLTAAVMGVILALTALGEMD